MDAHLRGRPVGLPHNLFGQLGPRCPICSGLGHVLRLGAGQGVVKSTTRCVCKGTGIDREAVLESTLRDLEKRMRQFERAYMDSITFAACRGPRINNSRQFWQELIAWATADGAAIANTTTEAIIFPNVTIPGNFMADSRALFAKLRGRFSVTATPTLVFAVRWGGVGGTILAQTGAIVTGSGITNGQFKMEFEVQTRANGATGSVFAMGDVTLHEDAVATMGTVTNYGCVNPMGSAGVATPAAVTVDLTADTALSVTADWSAASASNTLTGHNYFLEAPN